MSCERRYENVLCPFLIGLVCLLFRKGGDFRYFLSCQILLYWITLQKFQGLSDLCLNFATQIDLGYDKGCDSLSMTIMGNGQPICLINLWVSWKFATLSHQLIYLYYPMCHSIINSFFEDTPLGVYFQWNNNNLSKEISHSIFLYST